MRDSDIRLGFIARCDQGGLGVESWEFARHLLDEKDKVLVIRGEHGHFPDRFQGLNCTYLDAIPTYIDADHFLHNIDVLFSIETFYYWPFIDMARERGMKSVLRLNYEFQPDPSHSKPDLTIVPSMWNIDRVPEPKVYLPFPVNREVLPFQQRKTVDMFYHVAGHQLYEDRNGTEIFLQALRFMKEKPQIQIYTQHDLGLDWAQYLNVEVIREVENYWDVHIGDCLVLPRRYGGQSLQMNEALSTGALVLMPDCDPQSSILPKETLIQPQYSRRIQAHNTIVECYDTDPQRLAMKMDELYGTDISELNTMSDSLAESLSWDTLGAEYVQLFERLA